MYVCLSVCPSVCPSVCLSVTKVSATAFVSTLKARYIPVLLKLHFSIMRHKDNRQLESSGV